MRALLLGGILSAALASYAYALPEGAVACRTVDRDGDRAPGRGINRGPCQIPEPQQLIPMGAGAAPLLLTNFGVLWQRGAGATFDFVCEEYFGGKVPARVARRADGSVLVPGLDGVYASSNGCDVGRSGGSVEGLEVLDVATAPPTAEAPTQSVWALTKQPAALHVSLDGGATFVLKHVLPTGAQFSRLHAAAGGRVVYAAGFESANPLILTSSQDNGQSFVTHSFAQATFGRPSTVTELQGGHPSDPAVILVAAGSPSGADEIWRSGDGGATWAKTLTMRGFEIIAGFVWREAGDEVLVAGRELFGSPEKPPAHLYISRDAGRTFGEVIPSTDAGPRYRCLAAQGSRLFACGEDGKDAFLVGYSDDDGRTWSRLASLTDIEGSRPCAAGRCLTTSIWLCETYGAACEGLAAPEPPGNPDGGARDACSGANCGPGKGSGGCGCNVAGGGGRRSSHSWGVVGIVLALWAYRRSRRSTSAT